MKQENLLKIAMAQTAPVWRQNFDVAGHYSRPDVTKLTVNRERQSILNIIDDKK